MADMRAQLLLSVRDKLTGKLKRVRSAMGNVSREARRMRGGLNGVERASQRMGRAQARAAQDTRRATRSYQRQEQVLARLERRQRRLRNSRMMRGGAIAAGGATATIAGTRITRAAISPAKSYGTFDEQADAVAAIARVKSGSAQDGLLRSNARQLGGSTSFSAIEVSQGQGFLAMAGFDPKAIVSSMKSVLDLAKAGRVEIGRAADIGSDIGSAFGIEKTVEGMTRLADVMIGVTTRANTNVDMLGETMKYAAPFAKAFGASLETTSAMAGVMADNGTKGSQAGTGLSAMFARLAAPPAEAAKALKKLGIVTRDSIGNMRPIVDILSDINLQSGKLSKGDRLATLTKIAGLEASKGFLAVVDDNGLKRVKQLVTELKSAQGEANRVSKAMGDNLPGDIKSSTSAMAELGLVIGQQIEPSIRSLVQWFTRATRRVTAFAEEHPNLVKVLGLTAVALGASLTVGGALATVFGAAFVAMALMRFSLFRMGASALRAGGQVAGLRGGLLGLGRMKPLRWGRFIRPIGWLALAGALIWALLVSDIAWSDFLSTVKWKEWAGQLDWSSLITFLSIASFILPFSWIKTIGRLSWRALISPIKWGLMLGKFSWRALIPALRWGVRFIPYIGWAILAGELAWNLLIKPLGWDKYLNFEGLKSSWSKIKSWFSSNTLNSNLKTANPYSHLADNVSYKQYLPKGFIAPKKASVSDRAGAANPAGAFKNFLGPEKPVIRPSPIPKFRPQVAAEATAAKEEIKSVTIAAKTVPPTVRSAVSQAENTLRAINWATHGERMMATLAQGVRNGGLLVKQAVAAELAKARALLPSSNAKEGPLSNLTGNGRSILATMAKGVSAGGDGGIGRRISQALSAAPLLPQMAAAGISVGGIGASVPSASNSTAAAPTGNTFGNIIFNIYPQSAEDGAKQIEAKMRSIMHDKLND